MTVRFLTILIAALCATAASAQQPPPAAYAGRTVTDVRVFVERQPANEPALIELVESRPGRPLSMAEVRESITHLFSLGRFHDIQVEALEAPGGGVLLHYNLVPIHAIDRVDFRGTLGLSEGTLRDTITERFGRTPQPGRAGEIARVLENLYEDRGYYRATIQPIAQERHDPDRTELIFDIDSGPRAAVGAVDVVGEPRATRDELMTRVGVQRGQPYERERLNARLTDYSRRLRERGHLQAVASHTVRVSEDGRTADVTLNIQSGPIVAVRFEGDALPADRRDELVPIEREASVDEDLLEDSVQRIRAYLQQQGYWKADVTVEQQQTDDTLTVVFTVKRGPVYRVALDGVQVTGNRSVPIEEIRPLIVLKPGDLYLASHLDATVGALIRLYRTRGYRWAEVKSGVEEIAGGGGPAQVRPTIVVAEGPRAVLGEIRIKGAAGLSDAEVRRLMQLQSGAPYDEPAVVAGRDAVQLEYLNLGYASAEVAIAPAVSADRTRVDLDVAIAEGVQTIVDHVIIVGNRRTADDVIRRELLVKPGEPLGLRDLLDSRRRLSSLGLFRRIDIRQLEHGPATRRDVLVTVEEAPATSIAYGGGLEVTRVLRADGEERLEPAPRGFFDIGRRNVGGKNRTVSLFTRVSVRPRDEPENPDVDGTGLGFSEYRIVGTYREPVALLWNADLMLTAAVEQGRRSSFNFARKGVTAEALRRLTTTLRTSVRYTFSTTRTFDERLTEEEQSRIDRLFPQVRLSAFSGALARDTRDDVVEPSSGSFLSGEASLAARALGGQVGFLKTYLQGYWFKRLPGPRAVIFATRAATGLADGFPREAQPTDANGRPIPGPPEVIEDLPASERFFAGGDTTIRGFALDTVGTPKTLTPRGFPRGGNAVLIMNAELRIPVWSDFGAAVFVDGGNVFERVTDFDPTELRASLGFGVRYRSPIGPVRVDLGFKMDRREFEERRSVLHFSIGQAF